MKVSDYIAKTLADKGVPAVFELAGGMITHLLDSIYRDHKIQIISMRHEQAAAFAAEAAGRIKGTPGIAMATSGPGATNLLTGIGSCFFDSSPAIFITGQVNRAEKKGARKIRQLGFQETDIVAMAAPITKRTWEVEDPEQIPPVFEEAFRVATTGRKGPVLIDIPMDVQRTEIEIVPPPSAVEIEPEEILSHADVILIREALLRAKRPLILAGGGIRSAGALQAFYEFLDTAKVPVVHSLMGADLLPYVHPLNVGMIGSYGNRWANLALAESDCILVLGSRLDIRQTGADTKGFKGDKAIFHIDCEPGELNNRVRGCITSVSQLVPALKTLQRELESISKKLEVGIAGWLRNISALRSQWPDTAEFRGDEGINPNVFMHSLSKNSPVAAYVVDVGQHQMWAAQSLELTNGQRFLTSGGMGSMGFALPASIGASVCMPGSTIAVIAGDGGFQCNIQELQTVVHNRLPIKIVVVNNGCHGMVRQFQESYFEGRYQSTMWGYSAPDLEKVAHAYGFPAKTLCDPGGMDDAVKWLWSNPDSPALLQVMVSPLANAYPKMAFGRGLQSMEPFEKPLDMEST